MNKIPSAEECLKTYGPDLWKRMCDSGWLDGITVTIHRALCKCKCEKCGIEKEIWIGPPFDPKTQVNCECGRWKGLHIIEMYKVEGDIPQSDIERAYRAAIGARVGHWEMD